MRSSIICVFAFLAFVGCASKKAQDQDGKMSADSLSSEPMNFDVQGSDSGKIDGLSSIHFEFDKATLSKKDKDLLVKNAEWIKSHKTSAVQIEGHCDEKGSLEYNLALGERRAKAAYTYLVSLGVSPKQLSTISYGKEKLLTTDDSDEAQQKNRRDNFVPTPTKQNLLTSTRKD